MYKTFYLLPFLFFIINCKNSTQNDKEVINKLESVNKKNDTVLPFEHKNLISEYLDYSINDSILKKFSDRLRKTKQKASNGNKLVLEKYPNNANISNNSDKLSKLSYDLPNEIHLKKGDFFKISNHEIYELFKKTNELKFHKIKSDSVDIYHSILTKNKNFTIYSLMFETAVDCYSCEYGYKYFGKFMVSVNNSDNKILDIVRVSFIIGNDLGKKYKFYYYENNKIYTVYFKGDEERDEYTGKENYQITNSGRIIPYYKKNGDYVSDKEKGTVKENTRSNKWFLNKDIGLFNDFFIYIEGNYIKGIKEGEFKYYTTTPGGKKGKLICIEIYENGEIVKREFVKND